MSHQQRKKRVRKNSSFIDLLNNFRAIQKTSSKSFSTLAQSQCKRLQMTDGKIEIKLNLVIIAIDSSHWSYFFLIYNSSVRIRCHLRYSLEFNYNNNNICGAKFNLWCTHINLKRNKFYQHHHFLYVTLTI